jgi:hypothetical protein
MICEAEKRGDINKDTIIVEPTSGNQGIGLALIGAVRGYKVRIIMPDSVSEERRKLVNAYGAELILVHDDGDIGKCIDTCLQTALQMAKEDPNVWVPQQFVNPDNPGKRLKSSPELLVIFYNGDEEGLSDEQKDFLAYLRTGISPDQCSVLTEEVHREVNAVNHDQDWRGNLMTLEEILEYEKKKARKEAFEEGRKQGVEEGRITALAEMLQLNAEDLEKVTSSGLLD